MAVSIVEMGTGARTTGTTLSVDITSTPQPGDLIVALFASNANVNADPTEVSGCGATWSRVAGTDTKDGATRVLDLWIGAGATGPGTITAIYAGSIGTNGRIAQAWLVRGADPAVAGASRVAPSGPVAVLPDASVPAGGLIVAAGYAERDTTALSALTPSTGWAVSGPLHLVSNTRVARSATRQPLATERHTVSATRAGLCAVAAVVLPPAPTVNPVSLTGAPATLAVDTPAGTVEIVATAPVTLTGQPVSLDVDAPAGALAAGATLTGQPAGVTIATPAGTVVASDGGAPVDLAGAPISLTITAPAGTVEAGTTVSVDLTGQPVTLTISAPAGAVTTTPPAPSVGAGFIVGATIRGTSTAAPQHGLSAGFVIGTRIRQKRTWGTPHGARPVPRVEIATRDGVPICALDKATIGPLTMAVGAMDEWKFSILNDDPKAAKVQEVALEAQLWRGDVLMSKGPIGPGNDTGTRTEYPCSDPRWYLWNRRHIGRIPKLNLIKNGDFSKGLAFWQGGWDEGSAPEAKPKVSVVDEPESTSGKGLLIEGVDKVVTSVADVETAAVFVANSSAYLSGGEAKLIAGAKDIPDGATIHVVGHTADRRAYGDPGDGLALSLARAKAARASLAAHNSTWKFTLLPGLRSPNLNDGVVAGRGYYEQVASNKTEASSAKNRRVALHYKATVTAVGHRQYQWQSQTIVNPKSAIVPLEIVFAGRMRIIEWLGAPKDGWALRIALMDGNKVVEEATASMSEATPRQEWFDYSATISVPADDKRHTLRYQMYPPAGSSVWIEMRLEPQEQLAFFGTDRAHVVRDIIAHVQDETYGHGDLGIKTRTPKTGVTTVQEYAFSQWWQTGAAIERVTSLAHGLDVDCEVTPTSATIVTHFPRQGSPSGLTLAHGPKGIITTYRRLPARSAGLASVVVAQAWGISNARPERVARDNRALGGTQLEVVLDAPAGTPLVELGEVADAELRRSIHPTAAWEVTLDPNEIRDASGTVVWGGTTEALDRIGKGDTVLLAIDVEGVQAMHRVVVLTWDPRTDGLTLQLAPEET